MFAGTCRERQRVGDFGRATPGGRNNGLTFSLFIEPSTVNHIYELAKGVEEIVVIGLSFAREWEDPQFYDCTLPEDAAVHDLKVMLRERDDLEGFSPDNLRLYVH